MKKVLGLAVIAVFLVVGFGLQGAVAQEKSSAPKQARWHGTIVRINKDKSTVDVNRHNMMKTIHYDASTKWTSGAGNNMISIDDVKEGDDAYCLGTYNEKKEFVATQINVRPK
jgi:hypothetical protein